MASSASPNRSNRSTPFVSKGRRDVALLLFALIILFVVLLWFTFSSVREYLDIQEVRIEEYRGMSFDDAERELLDLGLDVRRYAKASPNQAFNTVVAQSLEANTMIRRGRVMNLGVHLPEESFNVPNLVGLDETEAITLLSYSKLNVGEVRYAFSDLEEGAIVSSSPPAQELLESGANVDLVISRGLSASKIEMPQLINLPLEEATNRLKAVGINRIERVVADADYRRVGQVVNQRPQAGRVTIPSAPVVLYYAMDNPDVVSVPNVEGMSLQQAYEALNAVGLELKRPWITTVNDPNQPQGVIEQKPQGFAIRGTPSYLVVNGAQGTLVTPSVDLTAPGATVLDYTALGSTGIVIGPDGLPMQGQAGQTGQSFEGQLQTDAFGNPISAGANQNLTGNSVVGPRPVPLPGFIRPISQFPQMQSDGTVVPNPQDNGAAVGQPFPNQFAQPLQPTQAGQGSQTNPTPIRSLNIQPIQPAETPVPNVQIGLSNDAQGTNAFGAPQANTQLNTQTNQVTQPPVVPPVAVTTQTIPPATDTSVRNIPIIFNPANYGFINPENEYRLIVIDRQGERELIRRNLGLDDSVNTTITMYGQGEIQTYVNGSLFQAWSP